MLKFTSEFHKIRVYMSCRDVIMVGLTGVITRLDLFEVDRQRREEEA